MAPALLDTVFLRIEPPARAPGGHVEAVVDGLLPDTCSTLHAVAPYRYGHLIELAVTVRRPRGSACRPDPQSFRTYVLLPGSFPPAAYTLKTNGHALPFVVP